MGAWFQTWASVRLVLGDSASAVSLGQKNSLTLRPMAGLFLSDAVSTSASLWRLPSSTSGSKRASQLQLYSVQPTPYGGEAGYLLPLRGKFLNVSWWWWTARASCLRLFWQAMRLDASRTFCTAGRRRPISTAMMAMTTSNSIKVKPEWREAERDRI